MAADMTGEQMQAKITAARREAEGLKDKIKRRKDELADTSRTTAPSKHTVTRPDPTSGSHPHYRVRFPEQLLTPCP